MNRNVYIEKRARSLRRSLRLKLIILFVLLILFSYFFVFNTGRKYGETHPAVFYRDHVVAETRSVDL